VTPPAATSAPETVAHAVGAREELLRVGGESIRCSVAAGDTRPLVLVSGMGATLETWGPFRQALGTRATIAFDAPGAGGSPTPWYPLSISALARLTLGLIDELGVDTFDILGYSFGGAVAQEVARAAPERVGALVLAAATCGWGGVPGDPFTLGALLAPMPVRMLPPVTASLRVLSGDDGGPGAFSVSDTAWARRPPNPLGCWWQLVAASGWTSLPWLHRVVAPTLVIAGARDRVVPVANARLLARRLPHGVLHLVADAGHFFLLADDPGPAAGVIGDFLDAQADAFPCT
jgi:poly(3-hydroxyoctanoate) depolymerase